MEDLIADLHIHSHYSSDSFLSPEYILRKSKYEGLNCISITDHNTIRGSIEAKKISHKYGIHVIIGAEIMTDCGDIIGLNLKHEINNRSSWVSVINEIKNQDGIVVFPHPYRDHTNIEEIASKVDIIECWNAKCSPGQNKLASDLATKYKKPITYGSDSHIGSCIGYVKMQIDNDTLACNKLIKAHYSTPSELQLQSIVSLLKHKEFSKLISQGSSHIKKKILNT